MVPEFAISSCGCARKNFYRVLYKRHIAPCVVTEYALGTMKYSSVMRFWRPSRGLFLCARAALSLLLVVVAIAPTVAQEGAHGGGLDPIRKYIAAGWDTLTRSQTECNTIVDPKLASASLLYVP